MTCPIGGLAISAPTLDRGRAHPPRRWARGGMAAAEDYPAAQGGSDTDGGVNSHSPTVFPAWATWKGWVHPPFPESRNWIAILREGGWEEGGGVPIPPKLRG